MAAAVKVKQFWTAIVSFFCGLLAGLLPSGKPAAPAAAARRTAAVVLPKQRTAPAVAVPGRRAARGPALPPTIKQRIRAEAHGSSPSVRRLPGAGDAAASPSPSPVAAGATAGVGGGTGA
ncbi:DUF6344 domain-containing protein [Streptomyces coeruleoprunus]|uniref:DUF6344 domain-containing protein n=1 Tax=Streptomyces coeruleoprunus TaxID=285563 RepID=A0ABV9XC05_9ACTN